MKEMKKFPLDARELAAVTIYGSSIKTQPGTNPGVLAGE